MHYSILYHYQHFVTQISKKVIIFQAKKIQNIMQQAVIILLIYINVNFDTCNGELCHFLALFILP